MKVFLIWFVIFFVYFTFCGESRTRKGITRWIIVTILSSICTIIYAPITVGIIYLIKFLVK